MQLNVNQSLQGFEILNKRELKDTSCVLYEMEHKKSGARLAYIDRDDENKTFAISFTTIPDDNTGVFHILEHSVLCGSDKYPVKEPFVELLKSSLNTFLNAMTFNDKTVYPVSSKNEKDFLNLISIYMDAVLHPMAVNDERVFRQEGWHYEVTDSNELIYNGVVYNEMKGAYSQVDNLSGQLLMGMLYPDSTYAKESGGNPDFIPDLTYEGFVSAHKKHYHPENSRIILDGRMDIERVLGLLDSFLSEYDRCGAGITVEMPRRLDAPVFKTEEFEITDSEGEESKCRLVIGWRTASFAEERRNVALTLIKDCLMLSNEAPLKKALLDSGLCKDAAAYELSGIADNSLALEIRDIKECDKEKIAELIDTVIKNEIKNGFDKDMLRASLEHYEFKLREADSGSFPRGLVYALGTLDTWLYGGDPAAALSFSGVLNELRELIDTDFYERLAEELLINNSSRATLLMRPSTTLADRRSAALREKLEKIKNSLPEGELEKIKQECLDFKAWQARSDTKEALSTLPTLELSDISEMPKEIPSEHTSHDGAELLYHPITTGGIVYSQLAFDCSDLTSEEISVMSLMADLLLNVKTESYDILSLKKKIRASFGALTAKCTTYAKCGGGVFVSFELKVHALERNKGEIAPMIKEILYTSELSDKRTLKNIISQIKLTFDEYFIAAGHLAAMSRSAARSVLAASAGEYTDGYDYYTFIKECDRSFDAKADSLIEKMCELAEKIFVKERLILNISCDKDEALFSNIIGALKSGSPAGECKLKLHDKANEAIVIPAGVAYASQSANIYTATNKYTGSMQIARMILNYEYLWQSIRVLGGAYGAGLLIRQNGRESFYSYRDPSPDKTVAAFGECGDFLRKYVKENASLTKVIIGAVGALSPLTTPRSDTEGALVDFIGGITYGERCRIIKEAIETTPADIEKIADILDALNESRSIAIVGGKELLEKCSGFIDKYLEI